EPLVAPTLNIDSKTMSEQEVLSKLHNPDRDLRRRAAESLTKGLQHLSRPLTYVFNTLLADKQLSDDMRKYDHWLSSRNLSIEISDTSVEALVQSVVGRYDITRRYYALKARLLGLENDMKDYDRYAPLFRSDIVITWVEAKSMVIDAYSSFDTRIGDIISMFFEKNWID